MGMMGRMRSLAPWFIITVGGLFVLFMVLSDSKVASIIGQQSNNLGSINGKVVTYREFSQMYENYKTFQEQQMGRELLPSQVPALRDQVWDAMVSQEIMREKIDELGITVTDEEIRDILLGPNPPAHLKSSFIDSLGNFNRELYEQAIFDPRNKEILIQEENRLRQQLLQKKLQDYVNATVTVNDQEVKRKFIEDNIKMKAEYVSVSISTINDSAVKVTENDLRNYYDENKEEFKISPQRKINYVFFRKEASKEDTAGVRKNLEAIVEKLKRDSADFKTYVEIYSDNPYQVDTMSVSQTPEQVWNKLQNVEVGGIVGPIETFKGFVVHKLLGKVRTKDTFINASHILIRTNGNDEEAKAKANEIYNELKAGADFAEVAKEKSEDGSASKGGSLGWFGEGTMVDKFWNACERGRVGRILRPIKTQFGYHIIKVNDKTNEKLVSEVILNKVEISGRTVDKLYNDAQDFAYLADKNSFDKEAKMMGYEIGQSIPFREEAKTVPGLGMNPSLVKFAFENSVGSIGDVYNVPHGYVVPKVAEEIEPGYEEFEDAKGQIRSKVRRQMKLDKAREIAADIKSKISVDDLSAAKNVYPRAKVNTTGEFTTKGNIPGIGQAYAVSSYSLDAELNQLSDPLPGRSAYFLVKVTSRSSFDSTKFNIEKARIKNTLLSNKKNRYFSDWLEKAKEEAEIVDERHLFYK